ncbi:MAG: NADH-quinone oxidoreductase subunit NuoH [Candidatus Hydrogenedentes bacterium]|nr:NADH-quinone oxidoreductase subunit NuoH [Candidatus Hydrogenedentota bacterium]
MDTTYQVKSIAEQAADSLNVGILPTLGYLGLALLLVAGLVVVLGMGLIWLERKIAAHFQCRLGPNRVGPFGIFQTLMDTIKLLFKEDIVPMRADKTLHLFAPFLALATPVLILGVIPYGPLQQVADISIGVLFVSAVGGFGVMGILVGGWSSNNKWSTIGAMRAGAQIISYELSATLALLVVVLFSGSMKLSAIVTSQHDGWWVWRAPGVGLLAFVIYLISSTAEINRLPFDIPEGESELAAGFHTEYSGMRFSFFFLAEFINMFVAAGLAATLFLGGWMPFHIGDWASFNAVMDLIPPVAWFSLKAFFIIFLIMWVRWTFPRLRVDQLMHLEWRFLLPIGFANLIAASLIALTNFYFYPLAGN